MIEEDRGFVVQQSVGNMTTIKQRYSHISKHTTNNIQQHFTYVFSMNSAMASESVMLSPLYMMAGSLPSCLLVSHSGLSAEAVGLIVYRRPFFNNTSCTN